MESRRGHFPSAVGEDEGARRIRAALVLAVAAASAFTFWHYLAAYPTRWPRLAADAALGFDGGRLVHFGGALLFIAALDLAAWQLGAWVRRAVGDGERGGLGALAQLACGLLVIPYLVLALAACGLLHPLLLAALLAAPCAAALPGATRALRSGMRRVREGHRSSLAWRDAWAPVTLAVFLVAGPLLTALGPHAGWDAEVYHLSIAERHLFTGGIYITPFSLYSAFPGHMEMFYVLALALSGPVAAKLVHFQFGVLLLVLLYLVAARESRRCAVLALLFLAAEPLLYREMSWAYNDLVGPFYALFAFVSLEGWAASGKRAPLLRAGLFAGACLATRYMGGAVLLSLGAALWLVPVGGPWLARARATLWLGGLAVLALLPWLVRNWAVTGNPVAPALQGLFHAAGEEFFSPLAIRQTYAVFDTMGMGRDPWALLKLPWNLTVGTVPGVYSGSFGYQVGPLHAIGYASALAVALLRRRRDVGRALALVAVFVLLWFSLFQESRYLLPLAGILALLGAWSFDELMPPRLAPGSVLWLFPLLGALLAWVTQLDDLGRRYTLALGSVSHAAELQRYAGPAGAAALRKLVAEDPGAKVFVVAESRSYLFRGLDYIPYYALDAPPALDWIRGHEDVGALHCGLQAMGATHVFANLNNAGGAKRPQPVAGYDASDYVADMRKINDLMNQRGRALYKRGGIGIVRLLPAAGCPAEPSGARARGGG